MILAHNRVFGLILAAVFCFILGLAFALNLRIAVMALAALILLVFIPKKDYVFIAWLCIFPLLSTMPFFINLAYLLFMITVVTLIRLVNKQQISISAPFEWFMLLFLVFLSFSIFIKYDIYKLIKVFQVFFFPIGIYFIAKSIQLDKKKLISLTLAFSIVATYLSILGIYEHFTKKDAFATAGGLAIRSGWLRVNGPFSNDAAYGVVLCFCLYFVFFALRIFSKKSLPRLVLIIVLSMSLVALIFNYYRGIWIAFSLGSIVWLKISKKTYYLWFVVFALIIIALYKFDAIASSEFFKDRLMRLETFVGRFKKFEITANVFISEPIFGIGIFNNFSVRGIYSGAHNTLLSVLSETGIIGSIIYIGFIGGLIYANVKAILRPAQDNLEKIFFSTCLSCQIAYLVSGLGLIAGYLRDVNVFYFAVMGLMVGHINKENVNE